MPRNAASDKGQSPLFADRMFYKNLIKNEKYNPTTLKLEMDQSKW